VNASVEVKAPGVVVEVGSARPASLSVVVVASRTVVAADRAVTTRFLAARCDTLVFLARGLLLRGTVVVVAVSGAVVVVVGDAVVVVVVSCDPVVVVDAKQACPRSTDPYTSVEKLSLGHETLTLNISGPLRSVAKSGIADVADVVPLEATDAANPVAASESEPICALAVPTDIAPSADPFVSVHCTMGCAFEHVAVP